MGATIYFISLRVRKRGFTHASRAEIRIFFTTFAECQLFYTRITYYFFSTNAQKLLFVPVKLIVIAWITKNFTVTLSSHILMEAWLVSLHTKFYRCFLIHSTDVTIYKSEKYNFFCFSTNSHKNMFLHDFLLENDRFYAEKMPFLQ